MTEEINVNYQSCATGWRKRKERKGKLTMDSTVWIGNHLSDALSYPYWSSPGGWRMEMQRVPSEYTRSRGISTLGNECLRGGYTDRWGATWE